MLLTLALPITLLCEACIWIVGFLERRGWNADLIVGLFSLWWLHQRGNSRARMA